MASRFLVEFTKENQAAFEHGLPLNMGQLLSIPFILIGLYLFMGKQEHNPIFKPLLMVNPKPKKSFEEHNFTERKRSGPSLFIKSDIKQQQSF